MVDKRSERKDALYQATGKSLLIKRGIIKEKVLLDDIIISDLYPY